MYLIIKKDYPNNEIIHETETEREAAATVRWIDRHSKIPVVVWYEEEGEESKQHKINIAVNNI